ncbi:Hypothetical predicted protein [Paramuricea clavata]|uniref:Uncharacterized protein n=1 Tax=Paramuricea clavata TaxID=317549 RepID=A0A6S7GM21_PARCT|nr:Hypothetical predicted protein [Paramuricea clavata]
MIVNFIKSQLFWTVLLYYISIVLGEALTEERNPQEQQFFRITLGVRSQREAYVSLRSKTALDCVLFCLREKLTCTSLNYAESTTVNNGKDNCQLHNETKNDDENSLKFLKDDRYTFYRIPARVSHESENVTEQANTTASNYLDHFNDGNKTSGNYTILDQAQNLRTVYCDMESEPGSIWTLIMSFARENKDLSAFKSIEMSAPSPRNKNAPNWSDYRMGKRLIVHVNSKATHWRVTCSFQQSGVDIKTDYVRAAFADFDFMGKFWDGCKNVSYISVMGQFCSHCTAYWRQGDNFTLTIPAVSPDPFCDIKSDESENFYFGAYHTYDPAFRCTESPNSTTNYWFGSYA